MSKLWIKQSRKKRKLDIIRLLNNTRSGKLYWQEFLSSPYLEQHSIKVINDTMADEPHGFTDGFIILNSHLMFNYEIISSECRFLDQYQIIDYRNVFASDVMPQMIIGAEFLYGFQYGIGLRLIVPEAYITKESIINVVEEFVKNDFKPFERIDRPFTTEERQQLKSRVVAF